MASTESLQAFADLDDRLKAAEIELSKLKGQRDEAEKAVRESMLQEGVQTTKILHNGGSYTFYLDKRVGVSVKPERTRAEVIRALGECGLDEYINREESFNTRSVAAWINGEQNAGHDVPAVLEDCLRIEPLIFARIRRS